MQLILFSGFLFYNHNKIKKLKLNMILNTNSNMANLLRTEDKDYYHTIFKLTKFTNIYERSGII